MQSYRFGHMFSIGGDRQRHKLFIKTTTIVYPAQAFMRTAIDRYRA
jgi:hypothetical protein